MKDRSYETRYRRDDATSRLISMDWRIFFISVILAFGLGFSVSRNYQSPSAAFIPERTAIPPARQESLLPSKATPDGSKPNSAEAGAPPNSDDLDNSQGTDESR